LIIVGAESRLHSDFYLIAAMKITRLVLCSMAVCSSLWADQLTISKDFNILSINGQKFSSSFLGRKDTIELTNGAQNIELQYEVFYDVGFDDHEKVTSKPFAIQFNTVGEDLKIDYTKPANPKLAEPYAAKPSFKILTEAGKVVPVQFGQIQTSSSSGLLSFFSGGASEKEEVSSTSDQIPSEQKTEILNESKYHEIKSTSTPSEKQNTEESEHLIQLRYWWQKASVDERQIFMREILR
jgi:uncharacterized protein YccT (UPF0319 family)